MNRLSLLYVMRWGTNWKQGGAIHAYGSGTKVEIHDSSFVSNQAPGNYVSAAVPIEF